MEENVSRCKWVTTDAIYIKYHDEEWGKPEYDSTKLFEMICLEGQQAGLSWITILKKRDQYRQAFCDFNPYKLAEFTEKNVEKILGNVGIVRHRGKIASIVNNSKCFLKMENNGEDFSDFVWSFVEQKPLINSWKSMKEIPTETPASVRLSKELKKRGFKFIGGTICYSFMQACGLVNDHTLDCFLSIK